MYSHGFRSVWQYFIGEFCWNLGLAQVRPASQLPTFALLIVGNIRLYTVYRPNLTKWPENRRKWSKWDSKLQVSPPIFWISAYFGLFFYSILQYIKCILNRVPMMFNPQICLIPKFDHITPVLIGLHWLPVRQWTLYIYIYIWNDNSERKVKPTKKVTT
jgi:hypothetical protein